jgi:glyoxylase-like metal-dependent hydrolase (beta-lactamase superfamily II)
MRDRGLGASREGRRVARVSGGCTTISCVAALFVMAYSLLPTPDCLVAASGRYEVREVKPHVFVWIPDDIVDLEGDPDFSRAGTAGFIVTPDCVVVIDATNSPFHGRELLYEITRRTEAPLKYLIDTDSESSHTLGNEVFVDEQATIISTADVVAGMKEYQKQLIERLAGDARLQARMRGIHVTPPRQTFGDGMRLAVPGQEIRLVSLNVGDSDAAVYLPQSKVLFLGNLFENGFLPYFRLVPPPRDIRRWIRTLRQVETWDVEIYVPGHGAPGGKPELTQFRQFLEWLANEVETRIKEGKSLEQVKAELLPQVEGRSLRAPELAAPAIEAVYGQLAAAHPPLPTAGSLPKAFVLQFPRFFAHSGESHSTSLDPRRAELPIYD